ncbi:U7 snRNA-associated Sm-like protein LSm11 [Drosophila albomicans]|uniref:U7 snRNA-associated Sm-like protein LSm11 n=1 Tax=Drosophila albomicans TaxID=7291 RepID=A0A6P8X3B0_DROAB|nr:U7 snRNA-associated Sm-like protein LSm11 [Drosophila albomicans]
MSDDTAEKDEKHSAEELDVGSDRFNPLRALYAVDYRVTEKAPKVLYQNLAAFESALTKVGIWQLNKRQQKIDAPATTTKSNSLSTPMSVEQPTSLRRFQPHQMAIKGTVKTKHQRNLFTHMAGVEGPLAILRKFLPASEQLSSNRIRVYLRKEHGIGGTIEGELVAFDKQWNLLLKNAVEVWQRRKYKYGDQKVLSTTTTSEECSARLRQLGIALPTVQVKSLSRKNVQLRRDLAQIMIRGENVVLISCIN